MCKLLGVPIVQADFEEVYAGSPRLPIYECVSGRCPRYR